MRITFDKFSGLALGAIFAMAFLFIPSSPASAQEKKPDFTGAASCSCYVQTATDNLGKVNGYLVRVDIKYRESRKPNWNHPVRMYRVEDRKKAGKFCVSIYKQYFKEEQKEYEAQQRHAKQQAASRPNHQPGIENSLAPEF